MHEDLSVELENDGWSTIKAFSGVLSSLQALGPETQVSQKVRHYLLEYRAETIEQAL